MFVMFVKVTRKSSRILIIYSVSIKSNFHVLISDNLTENYAT